MIEGFGPIARWLAEVYVMSTVVLAAAGAALLVIRQPARRLAVAKAAFVALASLGPLAAACGWARASRVPDQAVIVNRKDCDPPAVVLACGTVARPRVDPDSVVAEDRRIPCAMFGLSAASGLMIAWLGLGAAASLRLGRDAHPAPEHLRGMLRKIVGDDRRIPRLLISKRLAQPIAIGVIRPTIMMPSRFVERETDARVESALAHEWAHLRNGDLRLLALSRWLLPIFFAHP